MPEVCEVALTAEILHRKLHGKTLTSFEFVGGRYGPNRDKPTGYEKFIKNLPMKISKVDSRGKFLWFDLVPIEGSDKENHWYIWNTFGLTGGWSFNKTDYIKATLTINNKEVHFYDLRNFGTFKFSQNQEELREKLESLSPDVLKDENLDLSGITKFKTSVVSVLMDQKKIGSGIGNYLVAEVLYLSGISPHRKCNTLTPEEIKKLTYNIKYMVKLCYLSGGTEYMNILEKEAIKIPRIDYHPSIKIEKKDLKFVFNVYRQKEDPLGNPVQADRIVKDRTTYWVPKIQK